MSDNKLTAESLLAKIKQEEPELDLQLLHKACEFAEQLSTHAKNPFMESSLDQGLEMADELFDLNCDSQTLAAAILYPAMYYQPVAAEKVITEFGKVIHKLINGANRMEAIHEMQTHKADKLNTKQHTDNLRKMLLAIVDDIRIVLIKLISRLTILRHLKHCKRELQLEIAEQTINLYAPLANRLGIGHIKWQLEDLSFRYLNPDEYMKISKALNMRRQDREIFIEDMINKIDGMLIEEGLENYEITGRAKHIYSIHRKIERKRVDFSEIYDASALRILTHSIKDCYTVLSLAHAQWEHIAKEFDDYIAKPKPNGYRSIHTAVVGPRNINVEIQIRTFKMHDEAEMGVAAHWKYKEGGKQSTYEDKIEWLREVMDWQREISDENNEEENFYSEIFDDRVYVFTPNGDVFDLKSGATPLDFAYHVHTDVGHRCRGAKVNGKLEPLTHELKTGDKVEIMTSKEGVPSRDWLNPTRGYLKTSHAKTKVRHWFRQESYETNLEQGQHLWEKAYRREGLNKNALNDAYHHFNFKTVPDLLASVGAGDLSIRTVLHYINSLSAKKEEQEILPGKIHKPQKHKDSNLMIEGVGNLLTQLARCCRPIPGDAIIGYITKSRGITIHQQSCRNIQQAQRYRTHRVLEVSWGGQTPQAYPVDLIIEAEDRAGLVRDISNVIANENVHILGIQSSADKINNLAFVSLTIEMKSTELLTKIINQLRQINGIGRVERK